jgi:VIT1/CCC1 family predicted Fe2+/Mn2+ transporter
MATLGERGRALATFRAVRGAPAPGDADRLVAGALPPIVAGVMTPAEIAYLRQRIQDLPEPPAHVRLHAADWRGALGVFLLVFLSTFPVAVPFMVMESAASALRASNAVAVTMLFVAGVAYGRLVDRSPWLIGLGMVALGSMLVAMTIALGG